MRLCIFLGLVSTVSSDFLSYKVLPELLRTSRTSEYSSLPVPDPLLVENSVASPAEKMGRTVPSPFPAILLVTNSES